MLGLAASYRGTMEPAISKSAALVAIGILYEGSTHPQTMQLLLMMLECIGQIEMQYPMKFQKEEGHVRLLQIGKEKTELLPFESPTSSNSLEIVSAANMVSFNLRRHPPSSGQEMVSANDEDAIADLMDQRDQFMGSMQSRLTKLQVLRRYWERNDIKGAISAMEKMADHALSIYGIR